MCPCANALIPRPVVVILQFRAVGVNFTPGQKYLDKIKAATSDIEVQIIFNNAG